MRTPLLRSWIFLALLAARLALHAEPPGSAAAPAVIDPLRLTHVVIPVAQRIEFTLDPAKDDFSGRTTIDLLARDVFTQFRIHANGPSFTTATLTAPNGTVTLLTAEITDPKFNLTTLTAPAQLSAGNYQLTINYTAPFRRDGVGLYKTTSRGDDYLFTQFEDTHARKAFPCWDEPAFKINWQLTIKIPAALEVVSNAAVATESREGDWKTISFGRTPPMPSYIVALAVGPFEYVPVPGLPVPGRIITPRGQTALATEAVRLTPAIVSRLEEYFGIPYPYAKFDQLAVPEYIFGAMENAGLVTFTDRLLLMDSANPSFNQRRRLANVIAHEAAHMWFGNLVTMAWWDDLWLNESFADWMASRITAKLHPEFRSEIGESRAVKGAMNSDTLPSITAIRRPVTAASDLSKLVDELTYNKGKGVLTMVENWIGPDSFRAALQTYMIKHRWGNTASADLWTAFNQSSGEDISSLLAGFINQPGVPLVSVSLESDGRLRLTQQRFHNLGDPPLPGQWKIPVVLTWSKNRTLHHERLLLTETSQAFSIPGLAEADWIYPNKNEAGYYRWNISPELNARLARQAFQLNPIERIGLLDNTSALFSAGLLAGADYLAYVTAFAPDLDPDLNGSVIGKIEALENTFITPTSRSAYHAYLTAILRPILDRIGISPVAGEPAEIGPLRDQLYGALGFQVGDAAVIAECRRLTALFLENPDLVDAAVRDTALAITAYRGDENLLRTLQTTLEKAPTPIVRSAAIRALGSFHDPVLATQALDYSLTPALNSTEFLNILFTVSSDPDNQALAVKWAIAHYDAIAAKAPARYTARLIDTAAGSEPKVFNTLREFLLSPERKTEYAEVNINKAADRLANRLRLRTKEQANIIKFLETFPAKPVKD